jgi:hypothetical protein
LKISKILLVFCGLLIYGCGGSGGNPIPTARPLASSLRILQPGDSWSTGFTTNNGSVTGQINTAITKSSSGDLVETTVLEGEISTRYLEQDLSTSDLKIRRLGNTEFPEKPFSAPGAWSIGKSFSWSLKGLSVTFKIEGQEEVQVPLGKFMAWRVKQSQDTSSVKVTGIYWYAPDVGTWVKAEYTTTFTEGQYKGQSYFYNAYMLSTNVLQ